MKIFLFIFIILFTSKTIAQINLITNAIKNGDATELSKYFNNNIYLTILDKQNIYSKKQSEIILKEFFIKNIPSSFNIIYQNKKENNQLYIGILTTSTGNYLILFSKTNFIYQFKIEKEN